MNWIPKPRIPPWKRPGRRVGDCKRVFALFPTSMDNGERVWLEYFERCVVDYGVSAGEYYIGHYPIFRYSRIKGA